MTAAPFDPALAPHIALLRRAAERTLPAGAPPPDPATFRDEFGHRRHVDGPFLAWRAGVPPAPLGPRSSRDVRLWWALSMPAAPVEPLLNDAGGPTLVMTGGEALEVATEAELCALHALWRLAGARREPRWRERCLRAAARLVEQWQPDNATNHPWAAHVFIELHRATGAADPLAYAHTLVHNCQVSQGRPDLLSAHILHDAADALTPASPA